MKLLEGIKPEILPFCEVFFFRDADWWFVEITWGSDVLATSRMFEDVSEMLAVRRQAQAEIELASVMCMRPI